MSQKLVEQPRQIILSQIKRHSMLEKRPIKTPTQRLITEQMVKNRYRLPPINNQSQCRRTRTEPQEDAEYSPMPKGRGAELKALRRLLNISDSQILTRLNRNIQSLHSLQIISGGAVRNIKYSGHIKIPTVHNDYHSSKTNSGYSRNKYGGIYPK